MAKIKPGTYPVKQEMVCNDQGCVLRTTITSGRHRGTVVGNSPVQTPGLSAEEQQEQSTLEHHRDVAVTYLKMKVGPTDEVDEDLIGRFIATVDGLRTYSWETYFPKGNFDRGMLYAAFLEFRFDRK